MPTPHALLAFGIASVIVWFARSPQRLAAVRATGGSMLIGLGGGLILTGDKP